MSSKEVKEFVLVPKDKWDTINSHKRASETRMIKSAPKSSKCETAKVMKKDTTKSNQTTTTTRSRDNDSWIYYRI